MICDAHDQNGSLGRKQPVIQDWTDTGLEARQAWPQALRFALAMIERAAQPMLITWGPDRLIFYNDAFAPILDGKLEPQGRPIAEVFEEAWALIRGLLERVEGGDKIYVEDLKIPIKRSGAIRDAWWTVSYSKLPTSADEGPGVLCVVHETTRLHVAEQGLHAAQDGLQRIADLVPSLLWRADGFGRTIWQNGRLAELARAHGADAANIWRRLMHPADIDGLLDELSEAKRERRSFSQSVRLCMADRSYRWHHVRSEPSLDENGRLVGWFGVATDIQDVRDALSSLELSSAVFSQFAANAAAMLWVADLQSGEVTRLTPNFGDVWVDLSPGSRWTIDQFLASVVEADRPTIRAGFERVASGVVVSGRFRVSPADTVRVLQGTTFPILTASGEVARVGGILTDTTPTERFTVALIDTDPASQDRLTHLLRKAGLETLAFSTIDQFASSAPGLAPGPVLLRHREDRAGLERLAGLLRNMASSHRWIAMRDSDGSTREAIEIMRMGAADIVDDCIEIEDLAVTLRSVASACRSPATASPALTIYRLTAREEEIAKALAAGGTNKSIAADLGLSPRTVETHRSRLMERLGARSLAELVALVTGPLFTVDRIG